MDQPVAIKVMKDFPNAKERFEREIQLISAVDCEDIVKFIGFTREPKMAIVSEMMKGGSLQVHLWNIRPYTPDLRDTFVILIRIARAMAYLHDNGIIHRDLKPSSILLSESKKSAKLGDIGLWRDGLEGDFSADVGSIEGMAPEVYSRGDEQHEITSLTTRYNYKVDVYSFAFIFWEMLTNRTPYHGQTKTAITQAVIQKERPSVEGFGIPKDILDILNMCWEDDPLKRPDFWQVSEMIEDLLNLIDPGWDDLPAARTSGPDQAPKFCDPSSISTNLCSCCYLSVQPNPSCSCSSCSCPSCSCPSCSCFPSCFS
nr:serine/threonine-protein kinase HT1-like [Ipomoea batatas]